MIVRLFHPRNHSDQMRYLCEKERIKWKSDGQDFTNCGVNWVYVIDNQSDSDWCNE